MRASHTARSSGVWRRQRSRRIAVMLFPVRFDAPRMLSGPDGGLRRQQEGCFRSFECTKRRFGDNESVLQWPKSVVYFFLWVCHCTYEAAVATVCSHSLALLIKYSCRWNLYAGRMIYLGAGSFDADKLACICVVCESKSAGNPFTLLRSICMEYYVLKKYFSEIKKKNIRMCPHCV